MAANVFIQVLRDNEQETSWKVVGSFASANTGNTVLQSNTLFGANASKICLVGITDIQYIVGVGTGSVTLQWVSYVNSNVTIMNFGASSVASPPYGGEFNAATASYLTNNANTPSGDINIQYNNMAANDFFNFVISVQKEYVANSAGYGAGAWANVYSKYNNAGY